MSHPSWVRGLKQKKAQHKKYILKSHPSWVRGLKPYSPMAKKRTLVAPLVGAWIETVVICLALRSEMSHPSWVRGLKLPYP